MIRRGRSNNRAINPLVVVIGLAPRRSVHNPSDQDRDQEHGDEPTDQRPEHGPNDTSGVQCDLFVGRGEGPGHLEAALLAKNKPQLAGWPEPLGMSGTEGGAGAAVRDRAEHPLAKETPFAACFGTATAPTGHALLQPLIALPSPTVHTSKRISSPPGKFDFRKTQQLRNILKYLETAGFWSLRGRTARIFRSFAKLVVQAQ
jgi:hypothetical protein